ncbi:ABC transporter ATP-binding protein [Hyphomicrobium sp. CS1BSMeth3]|uniref:ABC transporter ATP-binding protein n=1 Tax=Hyphomicrobium sp. CS1BSMeth3 TaxID=1892844 RepID=UPI0015759E68|nr:ABC transporter ATP-binding protein [Hyphomicrobium sp. CS1BSMeth3]
MNTSNAPVTTIDGGTHAQFATGMRCASALTIQGACKTYKRPNGPQFLALTPVDAEVREGEFVSLVGPSGCGKTTLLKMCSGLMSLSGGKIVHGRTGQKVQPGSYGFVFQVPALLPWLTVFNNVLLPARILGLPIKEAKDRAALLLDMVGLGNAHQKRPSELSGGMQQRVSLARALLHDPDLLFMDEPFGALDAMTRADLNMELQRLHMSQGKTVLFVTHDIEEATLLSDRILVMSANPGRIVADIPVKLPRPRGLAAKKDPQFYAVVERIHQLLDKRTVGRLVP